MQRHSSAPSIPSISSNPWRMALTGLTALALAGLALPASAAIPNSERQVLEAIYNQTDGANWDDSTNWMGTAGTECDWYGITCDATEDHVTRIILGTNGLSGTLPDLSALTALEDFNVRDNDLNGPLPALPPSIQHFWAHQNSLSGQIPDLSTLPLLEAFWMYDNQLTGSLPSLPSSIINFYADNNQLSGSIPNLSALTALESFYVYANNLSGPLPALPASIQGFLAEDNQLNGAIPNLSALTALEQFRVSNNDLSGTIPDLSALTLLERFWVEDNQLTGAPASAPPSSLTDARVCPNYLELSGDNTIDSGWETATGNQPWNEGCTSAPPAPVDATAIPTLSAWTLALLSLLLGGIAIWRRQNAG